MLPSQFLSRSLPCCACLYLFVMGICISCSGLSPRERQQRQLLAKLDSSLKRELVFIHQETDFVCSGLEQKTFDPQTSDRAKIWQPISKIIDAGAKETIREIDDMITLLDTRQAYDLLTKGPWSDSLYQLLARFRQTSLSADKQLLQEFRHTLIPHEGFNQTMPQEEVKKILRQDFSFLTNEEAKALLHYWQKEVALTANRLILYCFHQVPNTILGCGWEMSMPLISQSQHILAPGETLTITAGVGYYISRANPTIYINGQAVPLTDNAVAFYKLKVGERKGKYSIPVVTEYLDASGFKKTSHINIDYKVQ
jgi:hypothetical protein